MIRIKARKWILALFMSTGVWVGCLLSGAGAEERCEKWVARVVSVQGQVEARLAGENRWMRVALNDTYCAGDIIRVAGNSRAAILLPNETLLRLDQKTTLTFNGVEKQRTSLLDLLKGAIQFFSRIPRALKLATPFVNGTVEGTEFFVRVERAHTSISVFEGRVAVGNNFGALILTSGQSATAQAGKAPARQPVVKPRDAVRWALYYPPILDFRPGDFPGVDWQEMVRRSIASYWQGDLRGAFSSLKGLPENIRDPRFFTYRAALRLSVGRVDEAGRDMERALNLDPSSSHAFALQAIVAVVQNRKERALELAKRAVDLDPKSSAARVALSYAQQVHFDLKGAVRSLEEAVERGPENALAWARLAELWLSLGYLDNALEMAQEAVTLNPNLARTQTVLGFALLTQVKTGDSKKAFKRAIRMDQAAPFPRLGLGLAKIREGSLKEGRGEIEIAASLDPHNALLRSYLGKAYFEEKRTNLDGRQYEIAKELDPLDPTPWFYDAIRKQTVNRPVEALHDLQRSIELNDNRAVYRSRLLLDEDLAARSASLGRIYRDLGFQQRALFEGWKSVNRDPSNHSAHRFLADSYSALPRHEIARVSELLQSQLLQPLNITPIQPRLAESDLLILEGAGPAAPAFNEFNPLFLRNRLAVQGSGVAGGNDAAGGEVVHSGVWGKASWSVGGSGYQADGFRTNNDLDQELYNAFAQISLTHRTGLQGELRFKDTEKGDLPLRFHPDNFTSTLRQDREIESARIGFHHAITPHSDLIGSVMFQDLESKTDVFIRTAAATVDTDVDLNEDDAYLAEVRHLFRSERLSLSSGAGHFSSERKKVTTVTTTVFLPFPLPPMITTTRTPEETDIHHTNLYVYGLLSYPENVTWTLGASVDFYEEGLQDRDQFNPKLGISWNPMPDTTLRGAIFRVLKRRLISNQTIEPTQVAGFNQFFDDVNATDAWRYGLAVDQKFSPDLYGGAEFTWRDLQVPFETMPPGGGPTQIRKVDWEETLLRAYLYRTPHSWVAASAEYAHERLQRDTSFVGVEEFANVDTHRLSFGANLFHPFGLSTGLKATYVDQEGIFEDPTTTLFAGSDRFWVIDGSASYRLPRRLGLITVGVRNLFDEVFRFQETDPASPTIVPDRLFFARFTLAF